MEDFARQATGKNTYQLILGESLVLTFGITCYLLGAELD